MVISGGYQWLSWLSYNVSLYQSVLVMVKVLVSFGHMSHMSHMSHVSESGVRSYIFVFKDELCV